MAREQRSRSVNFGVDRFSLLYLLGVLIIVFGVLKPDLFLTTGTLHSIASEQAIGAMIAIAVLIPMICGHYDLSVGATTNLSAILVTSLQSVHHWGMWTAIVVSVVASALVGVINGFIVVKLRVNSFIATLGMATIIAAVQSISTGQTQPFPPTSTAWTKLTQTSIFGFQIVVLYLLVLAFIAWWVLNHTPVGRFMYATGGNPDAARLSGVRVGKWSWLSLIASATICGVAGVLYGSLSGPSLTFGSSLLLPAFAAVFLGSTQIRPGRYNLWGTMLAVYFLATGVKGIQLMSGVQWANQMFNGVALIVAVALAGLRERRLGSSERVRRLKEKPDLQADVSVGVSVGDKT